MQVIFCQCESEIFMSINIRELYRNFGNMLDGKRRNKEIEM